MVHTNTNKLKEFISPLIKAEATYLRQYIYFPPMHVYCDMDSLAKRPNQAIT